VCIAGIEQRQYHVQGVSSVHDCGDTACLMCGRRITCNTENLALQLRLEAGLTQLEQPVILLLQLLGNSLAVAPGTAGACREDPAVATAVAGLIANSCFQHARPAAVVITPTCDVMDCWMLVTCSGRWAAWLRPGACARRRGTPVHATNPQVGKTLLAFSPAERQLPGWLSTPL